jgi:hypothetical protein
MKKNTGVRSKKSEGKSPKLNPCPVCGKKMRIVKMEVMTKMFPERGSNAFYLPYWYIIKCGNHHIEDYYLQNGQPEHSIILYDQNKERLATLWNSISERRKP